MIIKCYCCNNTKNLFEQKDEITVIAFCEICGYYLFYQNDILKCFTLTHTMCNTTYYVGYNFYHKSNLYFYIMINEKRIDISRYNQYDLEYENLESLFGGLIEKLKKDVMINNIK